MAYNATVIAASLDDKELRNSIDSLVQYVNTEIGKMGTAFDSTIARMAQSLRDLGAINLDNLSNVRLETGSIERAKAQKEEADAVLRTKESYDQLAVSTKKAAVGVKGDGYVKLQSDVDKDLTYIVNANKDVDAQMALIMQKEQALLEAKQRETQETLAIAQAQQQVTEAVKGTALGWGNVYEMQARANANIRRGGSVTGQTPFQSYDDFRGAIAATLGVQRQSIILANESADSYNRISSSLKQLRDAYNRLSATDRNSDKGKALIATMHEYEQALHRIQTQASRPVNLQAALGLRENTLEDIQYKMQKLAAYRSGLDVNKQKAEIDQVNREYARLQKRMNEVIGKNNSLLASNNALARSWNYMKNRLAFYFTVGASTQFIKNLIEIRSQYEMNERALGILVQSAERGTEIFNELSRMSLISPYTLIELSSAAKQLVAYDVAAKDVVDTTRRLADMASAVGVPMERLTYALGQIKAYGYLNSRDNRMFANAGIPLVKQLAEYYSELEGKLVSTADVYTRIKKKAVDYNDVMQVIYRMTDEGGRFFDFQAKMADTLKVRLANLTLAWNNMLNEMGRETQGVLTTSIGLLRKLFLHWRDIEAMMRDVAITFGVAKLAMLIKVASYGLQNLGRRMVWNVVIGKKLTDVMIGLGSAMSKLLTNPFTWVGVAAVAFTSMTMAIRDARKATVELNESIRKGAKENFDNINATLKALEPIRQKLSTSSQGGDKTLLDSGEAKKAWESIREQIELSSKSSDLFISQLLSIRDINERVSVGFDYLRKIRDVQGALQDLDETTIKIQNDFSQWWNLWTLPDSLKENIQDYNEALHVASGESTTLGNKIAKLYFLIGDAVPGRLRKISQVIAALFPEALGDVDTALQRVQASISKTTESMANFITGKGLSGDMAREAYEQIAQKVIDSAGGMSAQEELTYRLEQEKDFIEARHKMFDEDREWIRANEQKLTQEQIAQELARVDANEQAWMRTFGKSQALSKAFYNWLSSQHRSEIERMFGGLSEEELRTLDKSVPTWRAWIEKNAREFSDRWKVSFEDLWQMINDTSKMEVYIRGTLDFDRKQSVYDQLTEADSSADAAFQKIQRLSEERKRLEGKGAIKGGLRELDEKYTNTLDELSAAQLDYNRAVAQGGHSKKEASAAAKAQRQAESELQKAQRQAESELQKALKDEISLLDKARSTYKSLTKDGVSSTRAIEVATSGYEDSLAHINAVLRKYGVAEFDIKKYVGTANPRDMRDALQAQLDTLKNLGVAKPAEIKDLEVKLKDLNVDSLTFDQKTLTESLNNELNKIKESYEFAVELDADPELGGIFLDTLGISKEELAELPKTAAEVARLAQAKINEELAKNDDTKNLLFNLDDMLNRSKFTEWVEVNGHTLDDELTKQLQSYVDYVNKLRLDETKKTIQEWDKLLDKYAEYETKRKRIMEEAEREREIAMRNNASQDILDAIDKRKRRDLARVDFEHFQQLPTWVTATGDIANLTDKALGMLIKRLQEYKKNAKNLDAKQIKQINSALTKLYKEQRKDNPFAIFANAIDEAKERWYDYQVAIDDIEDQIDSLEKKQGLWTVEEGQKYASLTKLLKTLKDEQKEVSNISLDDITTGFQSIVSVGKQASDTIKGVVDAFGGSKFTDELDEIIGVLENTASMAIAGGKLAGVWGAVAGGALGFLSSGIKLMADEWSGNAAINRALKANEITIKRLQLAYKDLEEAIDHAYGTGVIGAQKLAIENKRLQLTELERQLALENSRKAKNRDNDKILDLESQIKDLKYEINNAIDEITNNLLGSSSVGDAAESMVESMISAFRGGEDAMESFNESVDDMIANIVKKFITAKYFAPMMEEAFKQIEYVINRRTLPIEHELNALNEERLKLQEDYEAYNELFTNKKDRELYVEPVKQALDEANRKVAEAEARLLDASTLGEGDVEVMAELLRRLKEQASPFASLLEQILSQAGLLQDATKDAELSALQQGIQGITESTANALEAYMNGVLQQVYLHSSLLTEIRDFLIPQDGDIQLSVQAQMLLQLQQSYQVQQSIQSILENWNNASGQAVRVELVA